MKTISLTLAFACITAFSLAAQIRAPVSKDLMITFANGGGPISKHNTDSYQTSCCSASNSMYLYLSYDISALRGINVKSAELVFAPFLEATGAPRVVAPGGTQEYIEYTIFNSTSFRESPAYQSYNEDLPRSDQEIGTLNVTVATKQQNNVIDINAAIRDSIAVGNTSFSISFGNQGGFGASVTVAAREANALSSYIKINYDESAETTVEATCAPCPCGSTSGKRRSGCPVCNVCSSGSPTSAAPSTVAPSTVAPTHPTDCWTCPAGMVHYWEIKGATADDKCACYPDPNAGTPASTTKAPSAAPTSTKASGENISGENNARVSGTSTIALSGLALIAAIVSLL